MRRSEAEIRLQLSSRSLDLSGKYLPRLELATLRRFTLYSQPYVNALVKLQASGYPRAVGAILFRTYAKFDEAHDIAVEASNSYNLELAARLKELSTGQKAITTAGIVSLLGVTQSGISGWVDQEQLTPYTETGEPHPRISGIDFHFLKHDFQHFCQWRFPAQ